jgi:hypothetical protein
VSCRDWRLCRVTAKRTGGLAKGGQHSSAHSAQHVRPFPLAGRTCRWGEPSRQRHAVADLDGFACLRRRQGGDESTGRKRRDGEEGAGYRAGKSPDFHLDWHMRSNQSDRETHHSCGDGEDKSNSGRFDNTTLAGAAGSADRAVRGQSGPVTVTVVWPNAN